MADNFVDYSDATAIVSGLVNKIDKVNFVGTSAQWDAVPAAEKSKYEIIYITDDIDGYQTAENQGV